MASPFTIGNFNGWVFDSQPQDSSRSRITLGTSLPDEFRWFYDVAPESMTTPALSGAFTPGDLVSIQWSTSYNDAAAIECLDLQGGVIASVVVNLIGNAAPVTSTLGVPFGTDRVRVKWGSTGLAGIVSITAIDIPGLVADSTGMVSMADGMPADWTFSTTPPDAGGQAFTLDSTVDSGDGGGSIRVDTVSGGYGWMSPGVHPYIPGKMYTFKARASVGGWVGSAQCQAVREGLPDKWLLSLDDMRSSGEWAVFGFMAVTGMTGIRIDVYGPPNSPIYLDSFDFPRAAGVEHASAYLLAPVSAVVSYGTTTGIASAALRSPAIACIAYGGGHAAPSPPPPTLSASGHSSTGEQAANLTLPSPSVSATTGAVAKLTLPNLSAQSAGTVTCSAKAVISLPSLTTSASATVSALGHSTISLPAITASSYAGALCSVTVGKVTTQATGTTGAIGRAQITLPLFEATASGTAQNHGSASIMLPSLNMGATVRAPISLPGLQLVAIGTAVVVASYEAYAINLNHNDPATNDEVTRYTNFPFTQIVRYQGSYFGVAADGLYLLEGTTDNSEAIPWAFKTAMTDFKSSFRKTVVSAYFGGRLGPSATIDLHVGEDGSTTYNYATVRSDHAQCYRQKFGRGLTARYYALGVAGGGTLEIDNIEFNTMDSTRRI